MHLRLAGQTDRHGFFLNQQGLNLHGRTARNTPGLPTRQLYICPQLQIFPFRQTNASRPDYQTVSGASLTPDNNGIDGRIFHTNSKQFHHSRHQAGFYGRSHVPHAHVLPRHFPVHPSFRRTQRKIITAAAYGAGILPGQPGGFISKTGSYADLRLAAVMHSHLIP